MIPFDQFKAAADAINYQYRHPHMLYALVKWLQPRSVVEVGTHLGMSAVWMARGLQENGSGLLHCIDNFCWRDQPTQEQQWQHNILTCGVADQVRLLRGRSEEVEWPDRVDMAYIDGNHTQRVCQYDLDKALSRLASCIVFNDTATCVGVQRVADLFRIDGRGGWDFLEVPFDAGLLIALKRQSRPAATQGDFDQWDKP